MFYSCYSNGIIRLCFFIDFWKASLSYWCLFQVSRICPIWQRVRRTAHQVLIETSQRILASEQRQGRSTHGGKMHSIHARQPIMMTDTSAILVVMVTLDECSIRVLRLIIMTDTAAILVVMVTLDECSIRVLWLIIMTDIAAIGDSERGTRTW